MKHGGYRKKKIGIDLGKSDFIKRLKSVGFHVHELNKDFFGRKVFRENAFSETSTLYIVDKLEREVSIRALMKIFNQ